MKPIAMNPRVDFYFIKAKKWSEEVKQLRRIVLDCELTEELKWGVPCYTLGKSNIVLIHDFKEYCALLFFQGALIKDTHKMLIQQTKNVQAARQFRFTNVDEVINNELIIKGYIKQAIELDKAGKKVKFERNVELELPVEFLEKQKELPSLKKAFHALTPGRQRAYQLFFSQPKQSKTRLSRIEKSIPQIMKGKGLND